MNKDLLIALMQKDLSELNVMLEGIAEWERVPSSISRLALVKAENILSSLHELSELPTTIETADENVTKEVLQVKQETEVTQLQEEVTEEPIVPVEMCTEVDVMLKENDDVEEDVFVQESVTITTVADMIDVQPSLNEIQQREISVVDSMLDKNKVTDLIQSISLGDRFRFQRELFSNNGEEMMQVFHDLNAMQSLDEAVTYLQKHFHWDMESDIVKDFYLLLNRKF